MFSAVFCCALKPCWSHVLVSWALPPELARRALVYEALLGGTTLQAGCDLHVARLLQTIRHKVAIKPIHPPEYLIAVGPPATWSSTQCTYRHTDRRVQATREGGSSEKRGTRPSPGPLKSALAAATHHQQRCKNKTWQRQSRVHGQKNKKLKQETFELLCKPSREERGHS